jgi:SAM-dependent methyltransferase
LGHNVSPQLFDKWPDQYDRWFETSIGSVIKGCEQGLIMEFLAPLAGERILDAGCGTGVFTLDILAAGAHVAGVDLSLPMLSKAASKCRLLHLSPVVGDILRLPFKDKSFDKAVSITALEFIKDAKGAVKGSSSWQHSTARVHGQSAGEKKQKGKRPFFQRPSSDLPGKCFHWRCPRGSSGQRFIFKKKPFQRLRLRPSGKAERRACGRALLLPSAGRSPDVS